MFWDERPRLSGRLASVGKEAEEQSLFLDRLFTPKNRHRIGHAR